MIDSITNSACLCYYVQKGLSYSGEETLQYLALHVYHRSITIEFSRHVNPLENNLESIDINFFGSHIS